MQEQGSARVMTGSDAGSEADGDAGTRYEALLSTQAKALQGALLRHLKSQQIPVYSVYCF
jgi:hypothetical protein